MGPAHALRPLVKPSLLICLFYLQYGAWSRPEAINQAEFALDVGVDTITFYENYFNISFPLKKQGQNLNIFLQGQGSRAFKGLSVHCYAVKTMSIE